MLDTVNRLNKGAEQRTCKEVSKPTAPVCPVAVLAEYMGGLVDDINRTQEEEYDASSRGDTERAKRLNRRSDALLDALHKARDTLPSIRAKSHFGAMSQVAVMSALAEWMSNTDNHNARRQFAGAIEQMAHSVASFLAARSGVDREHAALAYFLPTYMDYLLPPQD